MKEVNFSAAKVIIPHPTENKLLLASRIIDSELGYEPAGGRIEVDFDRKCAESFEQCAIREAKEELNLDIRITGYLGSYYFFWNMRPEGTKVFTACTLFLAESISDISELSRIGDVEMHPIYPKWIEINDILEDRIPIRNSYVGLKKLLVNTARALNRQEEAA